MKRKFLIAVFVLPIFASTADAQSAADSVYLRAQRMVSDGNAARGRAVVDSMLRSARNGSPAYAEALFWRAALAPTSQQSERDYRRLIVEYPLYVRTGDVLLRLGQLELLRGNRDAAAVHLRRIQTEHPEFGNQAAASYWLSRVLFEKNDLPGACRAIADARRIVNPDDVELKNQIDYQDQQCAGIAVATAIDPATTTEPTPAPPIASVAGPVIGGSYSVQVAAYSQKSQAAVLASQLARRGFAARVDGTKAPFRVRIGKYRTRADATAAQQRIKKSGISGIVVAAD